MENNFLLLKSFREWSICTVIVPSLVMNKGSAFPNLHVVSLENVRIPQTVFIMCLLSWVRIFLRELFIVLPELECLTIHTLGANCCTFYFASVRMNFKPNNGGPLELFTRMQLTWAVYESRHSLKPICSHRHLPFHKLWMSFLLVVGRPHRLRPRASWQELLI